MEKKLLTFKEACDYTGLSDSALYKLTSKRNVPHYKPRGKMVYFNRLELEDWLQQNRVATVQELETQTNKRSAR